MNKGEQKERLTTCNALEATHIVVNHNKTVTYHPSKEAADAALQVERERVQRELGKSAPFWVRVLAKGTQAAMEAVLESERKRDQTQETLERTSQLISKARPSNRDRLAQLKNTQRGKNGKEGEGTSLPDR